MSKPMYFDPLRSFGAYATWTFTDVTGKKPDCVFVQLGAPITDPVKSIVPYLTDVTGVAFDPPRFDDFAAGCLPLATPLGAKNYDRAGRLATAAATPEDKLPRPLPFAFWVGWPNELMFPDQFRARFGTRSVASRRGKRTRPGAGYVWTVWYDVAAHSCEVAFQAFDADGVVHPMFDVTRRPLADVTDALTVTKDLATLFAPDC